MLDTFQGLPVHALIVHATVVTLPLAAILVALAAVYPRFRVWAGPLPMVVAVLAVVLVPLSTSSGEELEHRINAEGDCPGIREAIEHHAELADWLIWLVIPLAVLAVVSYFLHRRGPVSKPLVIALAVLSVLAAGSVVLHTARVGHAGAEATWKAQCQAQ
ncbi:MAG: hypothetical protein NTV23_09930 [Propionibacteriales bacterium]|nr:hypothetical protein [Propionibacteriales bacterium]